MDGAGSSMADSDTWRPPRACNDYWSEWKHCKSIPNLFHYYYTYGEAPSCKQWKRDYENCKAWEKTRSSEAKDSLCKSERERVMEKQKYAPVWSLRKGPPVSWYLPLDEDKPK
ncbi:Chromosome 22 open reading frame 39 [Podarcis lilfordi]|uniref:Synaptic plasticity regulator PANTS n=2 Tax=Podarcis lilfordi TaxID=74358 RepID=A0AA35LJJ4_9SAUR|nr:Chromosome 22 open reading frame 39 [Podarcis lilfordi]